MEKIISINFQGRVIPIEESAYNNLKQYIDSLRRHFAKEESSDEIINDIENRIAELLSDRLKRGAPCIVSNDVSVVIDSIGRLEDIEAAEGEEPKEPKTERRQPVNEPVTRGRFFRNEDDKVIAGVCSGIAVRTGMDPVIVRILFVILIGAFFWVYILLWIIVPSQSFQSNITRRLYRNPDDKVIAGVCGGLAAYFKIDTKIVRLIFLIPLIISIFSRGVHSFWWHWWGWGPGIFVGSLSSTLLIGYIILWIALPYATSAADKLEMRGEKVDMNSIKAATQARGGAPAPRPRRSGLGRVIAILFKAFFLLIAGTMAIALFGVLIGLLFGGIALMPYTDYVLDGWGQYVLAWTGIILFLGIPLLALITWGVRRIAGVRSRHHYLGYIFSVLWIAGVVCSMILIAAFSGNFRSDHVQEDVYPMSQPSGNKLYVNVSNDGEPGAPHYHKRWGRTWMNDGSSFRILSNDMLWLNTVKVKVVQSSDSLFHIYKMSISRGHAQEEARTLAAHINFNMGQQDSILTLPRGFTISKKDKFRNQQVMIVVEVPVGKAIVLDKNIDKYEWFNVNMNGASGVYYESRGRNSYYCRSDKEYVMTAKGLKNLKDTTEDADEEDDDGE